MTDLEVYSTYVGEVSYRIPNSKYERRLKAFSRFFILLNFHFIFNFHAVFFAEIPLSERGKSRVQSGHAVSCILYMTKIITTSKIFNYILYNICIFGWVQVNHERTMRAREVLHLLQYNKVFEARKIK